MTAPVTRLGYLAIGVTDLVEATEFYRRFVRLDVTEQVGRTVFLTGGLEHHWLRLEEGSAAGVKRVGYEVNGEAGLIEIRDRLDAVGIDYTEGGDLDTDGVARWLRCTDPGGMEIELFTGMYERGVAPDNVGITMEKFLHAAWATANFDVTTRFYQDVLGFRASDWIGDRAGFFRSADRFHHSLVLLRAERPVFNHFCIQVSSLDDVMRARNHAIRGGVTLRDDLLRHAPSGSIGFYMKDEARKFAVEFCVGHPQLDELHEARILPMVPQTRDVWLAELPELAPAAIIPAEAELSAPAWIPGSDVAKIGAAVN